MERKKRYGEAYGLEGPDDARRLYGSWAADYDQEMVEDHGYRGPEILAAIIAERVGDRNARLLDVGCGTGLLGRRLAELGFGQIDGLDLVQEMLDQAATKGCYQRLVRGDLLSRVPLNDDSYDVAVSVGTFTHNHVGPGGLDEVVRLVKPGGHAVLMCNAEAFAADGYDGKLAELARLGLADIAESIETEPMLDNGIRGRVVVLDIHR